MQSPKNFWQLILRTAGMAAGFCFLFGLLCLTGLLPISREDGSAGGFFLAAAGVFLALFLLALWRDKAAGALERKLRQDGQSVPGTVIRLGRRSFCRWNGDSPFVVTVRYTVDGADYLCRSNYYWDVPSCKEGSAAAVLVDPGNPKAACIDVIVP